MPIDFRNTNTVWASILAETLKRLGLTTAIICPGSRSTPLAVAFAQDEEIEAIPVLDERSAAFFALGIARATSRPIVLVCTSGTAGANFYPAVIEARESRVPLLILTADRPPEMRECHSGQTIDQLKLYGNYPNWQAELAVPCLEIGMLNYLRQTVVHAWERSLFPTPGPVHLNLPFRDPLAPLPQFDTNTLQSHFQPEDFFSHLSLSPSPLPPSPFPLPYQDWQQCEQGIIIAGLAQPQNPRDYCEAIAHLSQRLKWPVLAEGLSPVRNYANLNPYLISTYDLILRNRKVAQQLAPKQVIQIGELPTSKELRAWLDETQPQRWIIDPSHHNLDPLHGKTTHLRITVEQLEKELKVGTLKVESSPEELKVGKLKVESWEDNLQPNNLQPSTPTYLQKWCKAQAKVRSAVDQEMAAMTQLFEGKVAWLLSQILPPETPLFIANSMPVRDVEYFWQPNNECIRPFFNRGANGIDGTLSTALGIAHRNQSSVMLTGDLALLHDTNGFLFNNKLIGHLTIVLINNNGGGIFEMLPISKFDPPFEAFFATPQAVNFAQLCVTYGVEHHPIQSWEQLKTLLNPLPDYGIRVLELQTDRKADASWRQQFFGKFADGIGST
ncbi:MAG: 2-succinyl-5-enolpyruvyl-6-hydroxy-3-cyclohexene-1-carboxylic-acid synthase [Cyanobacteriota bacterium]